MGGIAEAVAKMAVGNDIGLKLDAGIAPETLFTKNYGGLVVECTEELACGFRIGVTTQTSELTAPDGETLPLERVKAALEGTLESVYPTRAGEGGIAPEVNFDRRGALAPKVGCGKPLAVIRYSPAPTVNMTPPGPSSGPGDRRRSF